MKRRAARITAVVGGVLLVLLVAGVVVLTMTDFGRERVRLFSVDELAKRIEGDVTIGEVTGNLLSGATLSPVVITDTEGRPFLRADSLSFRYSIRSLFQKHLVFTDVRLVRPVVVFDQPPGEEWNVTRIFPRDSVVVPGDTVPGWGDWVRIEDLEVVHGTVTVKREWQPAGDAGDAERALAAAVSPDSRQMIASAPGGLQSISSFHRVQGSFPLLRLANPDSAARVVEVDSLSTLALPFRPPAARVRNLTGRLTITGSVLGFHDVEVTLPDSRLTLDGAYTFAGPEEASIRLSGDPVSLPDLRWLRPSLPDGRGSLELAVGREGGRTRLVAQDVDLTVEGARLTGSADVEMGEGGTRLARSEIGFQGLDTRTVERLAQVDIPVEGVAAGRLSLSGTAAELDVDGWTTIRGRGGATSRIEADGVVVNQPGGVVARNLELRFDPLQLALARSLRPELPLEGHVVGRARLDGPLEGDFTVDADLVHDGSEAGRSRILARGGLRVAGEAAARDLLVRVDPLQSELVRVFAPDFPIGGLLTGRARLDGVLASSLTIDADLVHTSPGTGRSRVIAQGGLLIQPELVARDLRLRLEPLQPALVRIFAPDFPLDGTVTGRATVDGRLGSSFTMDADLVHDGPRTGRSRVLARGGLGVEGVIEARDLRLRFEPLQPALVRVFAPDFPLDGIVTGRATVDGPLRSTFQVDADLVHDGTETGRSRIVARGGLRVEGGVEARNLELQLDPLRLALVRALDQDFPLRGSVDGRATLTGSPSGRLAAALDITHTGPEGTSVVSGDVTVGLGAADPVYDIDVRVEPLAMGTVARLAPGAGLHGSVSGTIEASGTLSRATLFADLEVAGGGALVARGTVGVGPSARYDLRTDLASFDASALVTGAPSTTLTGSIDIEGVGTELATADAVIDAALVDSRLEGAGAADSTRVLARLEGGLAIIERGHLRFSAVRADVEGSFGLVAGRSGELRYVATVDSLSRFSALVPADTGMVEPRPLPRSRALAEARRDSMRTAGDRLVESLATGEPMTPPALDTAPPLPRDSVSGRVRAEGVLSGNVERFDVRGTAELEEVVMRGVAVGSGQLRYDATNVLSESMVATVDGEMDRLRVSGFAFDDATLDVTHRGALDEGSGRVELVVTQDAGRDYAVEAEYALEVDRSELRLQEVALRFDTALWTSTGPGAIRWAGGGVEVDDIELTDGRGGRIFADGLLRDGGSGNLRLELARVPIGHLAGLVQDTVDTHGLLSLDATVTGSLRAPILEGRFAVDSLRRGGQEIPDFRADFEYADRELVARTEVLDGDRSLLEGEIRIPIDLALSDREGPRILGGALAGDFQLDSLPLESLPVSKVTTVVENLRGHLRGEVSLRGTFTEPQLGGSVELVLASADLPAPGLVLRDGSGAFRLLGDRLVVDSLVASSGGGPVRVTGSVALETLTRPELDLAVTARDALVLDNDQGSVRADLDIDVRGTFSLLRVTGEARVESGEIRVPEPERYRRITDLSDPLLADVLDTLNVRPELRPRAAFEGVDADLSVRIDRDTWLRNSDLHVEIYTPSDQPALRVRTEPEQGEVSLYGVVHSDRGEYTIAGRAVQLNSGSVTFLGTSDPDPLLQLNAQHEVPRRGRETLVVLIHVGGRLSEPQLALSSNAEPPVPESDLLSYLAFGQETSSLLASEGSGLMGDALGGLGVLAEQQLGGLGLGALTDALLARLERAGIETGLDVFRVRPGSLPDELNYGDYFGNVFRGVEVEVGEYIGERLFLSAKARPNTQDIPGLRAEYRTPGGFSWITAWEQRYLPSRPTLGFVDPSRSRVFGSFLLWKRRF